MLRTDHIVGRRTASLSPLVRPLFFQRLACFLRHGLARILVGHFGPLVAGLRNPDLTTLRSTDVTRTSRQHSGLTVTRVLRPGRPPLPQYVQQLRGKSSFTSASPTPKAVRRVPPEVSAREEAHHGVAEGIVVVAGRCVAGIG